MSEEKIITGNTEEEIWQQLSKDLSTEKDLLEYDAVLKQDNKTVILSIDIDLGGGFEGGYETTSLIAPLQNNSDDFKFAIHHEHFLDEVGKFFGMQDVVIGYDEFDKKVIVKTNDEEKVKAIFADESVRKVFQSLDSYTFSITTHEGKRTLEFNIDEGITNPTDLREIYHAFFAMLETVDS